MNDLLFQLLRLIGIRTHRTFRLAIRAVALVTGLFAAHHVSMHIQKNEFDDATKISWIVLGMALVEFVFADVLADHSFPFDTERKLEKMEKRIGLDTIAAIENQLRSLIREFRCCDQNLVRAAVHVKAELLPTGDQRLREGLLQLTEYVSLDGEPRWWQSKKKGRITLINQGIVGRCARTEKWETVGFADQADYMLAMVTEFGFTKAEAGRHTNTARSYLAWPLLFDSSVVGVLYFFTTEPQVFPRAANLDKVQGLADHLVEHIKIAGLI